MLPTGNINVFNTDDNPKPNVGAVGVTALGQSLIVTKSTVGTVTDKIIVVQGLLSLQDSNRNADDTNIKTIDLTNSNTNPCIPEEWLAFR